MKTFQQFIIEAYDHDIESRSQITKQGEGGRIGRKRKQTDAEKKRVRAVGVVKLYLLKHIKIRQILVKLIRKDLLLVDNSNQHNNEVVPHYQQKRHKRRHI